MNSNLNEDSGWSQWKKDKPDTTEWYHTHTQNPNTSNRPFTPPTSNHMRVSYNSTIQKQSPIPYKIKLSHILQIHAPATPQKKSHQLQLKLPRVLIKTTTSSHLEPMQTAPTRVQQSKPTPRESLKLKKNQHHDNRANRVVTTWKRKQRENEEAAGDEAVQCHSR